MGTSLGHCGVPRDALLAQEEIQLEGSLACLWPTPLPLHLLSSLHLATLAYILAPSLALFLCPVPASLIHCQTLALPP